MRTIIPLLLPKVVDPPTPQTNPIGHARTTHPTDALTLVVVLLLLMTCRCPSRAGEGLSCATFQRQRRRSS